MENWLGVLTAVQTPLITFVNAVAALLIAFDVVFTQTQLAAADGVINAFIFLLATVAAALQNNKTKAAPA